MINFLVRVAFYGRMVDTMRVNGIKIKCMVKEDSIGWMEENMMEK